jgi:hypothetical protein
MAGKRAVRLRDLSNGIATNMALFPHLAFDGRRDFVPAAKI